MHTESNKCIAALPGLNENYSSKEARAGLANSDSFGCIYGELHTTDGNSTSTAHEALPAEPKRNYMLIQNNGSVAIYIKFGEEAGLDKGLKIEPSKSWETRIKHFTSSSISIVSTISADYSIFHIE